MRVGVVGLGDIAQKAYLPVLAVHPGISVRLATRNRRRLDELGDRYRIDRRYGSVAELIEGGIDAAFVHTPTATHVDIVNALLDAGVHVFVDKPLSYDYPSAEGVVRHAERVGCSLVLGFNRRFVPLYRDLLTVPRGIVIMQKNRVGSPESPRRMVFDDFIHVVDTLRFLAPGPTPELVVHGRVVDGLVHAVVLQLSGPDCVAIGVMNRRSGATEEIVEIVGAGSKRRILNLVNGEYAEDGVTRLVRWPDWAPTLTMRGFQDMCAAFLDDVRAGRIRSAADALETHAVCEQVVVALEGARPAHQPTRPAPPLPTE